MLGLESKRYVPVLLKNSTQLPVLINPLSFRTMAREANFLQNQPDLSIDQWHAKDHFFERIRKSGVDSSLPETWHEIETTTKKLSLEAVSIPCFSDPLAHDEAFKGLFIGMTELFHPHWDTVNIGSSRNALLSEIQIKGCGRTLPVNNLLHTFSSGTSLISQSVHSFLIAQILDTTLPLGALPAHAVFLDPESEDGKSLYLRTADSVRMAQIPGQPVPSEILHMRSILQKIHPGCSPSEIVSRVMAQYASNAFLGGILQSTPDNLLLDGRPIDEEDWHWPRKLGQLAIDISFEFDGDIPNDTSPQNLNWERVRNVTTTFSVFRKSIRLFLEGLGRVIQHEVSQSSAEEKFHHHLKSLWSKFGIAPESFTRLWEEGSRIQDGKSAELWISKYSPEWHYRFGTSMPKRKYFFILSPSPIEETNALTDRNYGAAFGAYQKLGVLKDNSFQLSRKLLSVAARASHWLPLTVDLRGDTVPNLKSLEGWWTEEMRRLGGWEDRVRSVVFQDQKGVETIAPMGSTFPNIKSFKHQCLPIAAVLNFKEGDIEVPLRKIMIEPK